jgi:ABC-2 type transport system permease protein
MSSATSINSVDQRMPLNEARPPQLDGSGLTALWALFGLTIRQYLHGKRWMVIGALFLLPAGLAILIRLAAPNVPSVALEFSLEFMLVPQAILPLVALLYGSGMILDELEEQTITYLLIRPLRKWALYIVKLLATITTAVLLTSVFTAITYVAIFLGADSDTVDIPLRCLKAISIHSLAVTAYCCLFGLISLLTKRSLVVGILYIAVIEFLLANLPFGIRLITIIYYARLIAFRTLDFVVKTPRGTQSIAADAWQFDIRQDPNLLAHPQLLMSVEVLLIASLICTVIAAIVFSRKEFHVKTPASN